MISTKTRNYVLAVVGLLLIILIMSLFLKKCNAVKPEIIAAVDSVQYWKNKAGQVMASVKQYESDFNRVKEGLLDSIAKLHNTKQSLINELISFQQKGSVSVPAAGKPEIVYRDTGTTKDGPKLLFVSQHYSNPYYKAVATIRLDGESPPLELQTYDSLRIVFKTVKEGGLFNRREYLQLDITNTNPYDSVYGVTAYRKPLPKANKFGIGVQAGFGFSNSLKPSPYIGIGVSYNIIRF